MEEISGLHRFLAAENIPQRGHLASGESGSGTIDFAVATVETAESLPKILKGVEVVRWRRN